MTNDESSDMQSAEVVVPCVALDATLEFFTNRLGFRVEAVLPADDPIVVVVSGHGVRLRFDTTATGAAGVLRLPLGALSDPSRGRASARRLTAPNGMQIELIDSSGAIDVPAPDPSFELSRLEGSAVWRAGRAGMHYRDLIPGRQGGRYVASHIRVEEGGPVPDYVHFHRVRFQMIFCYRGWVRVVYESQGPEFVLSAGDCVLQPPGIRHRVLESSAGLEVIEVSSPAAHETLADHDLELPTPEVAPDREFDGQRFVRSEAARATWKPGPVSGFEARDLGIGAATQGLAQAALVRSCSAPDPALRAHELDFALIVVLEGGAELESVVRGSDSLSAGDAVVIPPGFEHRLTNCSSEFEYLGVKLA